MAQRDWIGRALDVAHVLTADVTAYDAATTYRLTVNTKAVSVVAAGNDTATATALAAAWNNQLAPEFKEAAASAAGATLTLTGLTPGVPLSVASSVSGGTGTFDALANTTTPTGPNWWSDANNWEQGATPANGDDVTIDGGPSILYGLDQGAVTLASLRIGPNFPASSEIGLPDNSSPQSPSTGYPEFRTRRLTINATTLEIDTASRRIRLAMTGANSTVVVMNTGQPQVTGEFALDLVAGNATTSTAAYVARGVVGLDGNCTDLNVSFQTSPESDATVHGARTLTLANLDQSGGVVTLGNGATTITKSAGIVTLVAGDVTTLNNNGGRVFHDGGGNITTLHNFGVFERRGFQATSITDLTLYARSQFSDRNGTIAFGNDVILSGCRLAGGPEDRSDDVAYADFGRNKTITVS